MLLFTTFLFCFTLYTDIMESFGKKCNNTKHDRNFDIMWLMVLIICN